MQHKECIAALAGTVSLGLMAAAAQAMPLGNLAHPAIVSSNIEEAAAYCWWRNGMRHCGYGYGPRYRTHGFPNHYRAGSRHWWEEMDRDQRGGRR